MLPGERENALLQFRLRLGHVRIDPKLHPRRLAGGGFQQIEQHRGIGSEHIVREPQPMHQRHRKRHVGRRFERRMIDGGIVHQWREQEGEVRVRPDSSRTFTSGEMSVLRPIVATIAVVRSGVDRAKLIVSRLSRWTVPRG